MEQYKIDQSKLDKIKRRLSVLKHRSNEANAKYRGKEEFFTAHGGYDVGHIDGAIAGIEFVLDCLEEDS